MGRHERRFRQGGAKLVDANCERCRWRGFSSSARAGEGLGPGRMGAGVRGDAGASEPERSPPTRRRTPPRAAFPRSWCTSPGRPPTFFQEVGPRDSRGRRWRGLLVARHHHRRQRLRGRGRRWFATSLLSGGMSLMGDTRWDGQRSRSPRTRSRPDPKAGKRRASQTVTVRP